MEQIVVIAVFAFCAAVCVKILAVSYLMTVDAADTRSALIAAQSVADVHKAAGGDAHQMAEILKNAAAVMYSDGDITVYYCANWQWSNETEAHFLLRMTTRTDERLVFADITVSRVTSGDELVSLTAAARRAG